MRCLVLFAGGGGSTLGLHRAGWDTLGVEWDAEAHAAHERIAGPCILADLRDHAAWLPRVAEWAAGEPVAVWASPPCQVWSSAGSRLGAADTDRNGWPWTWDAVDALRDRGLVVPILVAENVTGMLQHPADAHPDPQLCRGCYLDRVVLGELRARWPHAGRWAVDAADYGVPQHRRRVIAWGAAGPLRPPPRTHHPTGGLLRPWWRGADTVVAGGVVGGGSRGHGMAEWRPRHPTAAPAATVTAYGSTGGLYIRAEGTGATGRAAAGPAPTVCGGGTIYAHDGDPGARPAPTVTATVGRRLTVAECAGLQSWPEAADTSYRVVGNAVPPPLAEAIGRVMAAYM